MTDSDGEIELRQRVDALTQENSELKAALAHVTAVTIHTIAEKNHTISALKTKSQEAAKKMRMDIALASLTGEGRYHDCGERKKATGDRDLSPTTSSSLPDSIADEGSSLFSKTMAASGSLLPCIPVRCVRPANGTVQPATTDISPQPAQAATEL